MNGCKKLLLMICGCFIFIAGCSGNSLSSAKLSGHEDEASFEQVMQIFCEGAVEDFETYEGGKASLFYEWKDGWPGQNSPDLAVLLSHEVAVTFVMSVELATDGEIESNRMAFYMIHNTKENVLSVQGGFMDEDGDIWILDAEDARDELELLFEYYLED